MTAIIAVDQHLLSSERNKGTRTFVLPVLLLDVIGFFLICMPGIYVQL